MIHTLIFSEQRKSHRMQRALTQALSTSLKDQFELWHTRRETLVWLVSLMIQTGTVSLWRLAGHVDTQADTLSVHRRFERFFQHVRLDGTAVACLLVNIMGLAGKPWHLAVDRTNWKFGRCHINILMLGIVHGKVCIPLFWVLLDKAGNSNSGERTDLMGKMTKAFPDQVIASLSGDREFIGEAWLRWLHKEKIPFVLRLKENMLIWKEGYVPAKLSAHSRRLKKRETLTLNDSWHLGTDQKNPSTLVKIVMMRLKTGDMLILAVNGVKPRKALAIYRNRWGIETLFSCLKKRGLGIENTHMTDPGKLETLMAVLAIAFGIAYKTGLWAARLKPIRNKAHGRRQRSIFALGLNAVRKIMVKMNNPDICEYIQEIFKSKMPQSALIRQAL